jgi:hypothetical protein
MLKSKEDKPKSRKGKPENLISLADRTTDEQREIAKKGGVKSGEVRKEKKLMSQILADYLNEEHEVVIRDDDGAVIDRETIPADKLIRRTVTAIMAREDSASVQMLKTISEVTEGKNVNLTGSLETYALTPEQRKARIDELEAKRKWK